MTGTGGDKDRGRLPRFIVILVSAWWGWGPWGLVPRSGPWTLVSRLMSLRVPRATCSLMKWWRLSMYRDLRGMVWEIDMSITGWLSVKTGVGRSWEKPMDARKLRNRNASLTGTRPTAKYSAAAGSVAMSSRA